MKSTFKISQYFLSLVLLLIALTIQPLSGQTINFSVHVASSLDATKDADMAFPQVFAGDGITAVGLGDGGMGVFAISGNEELDVEVTLVAPTDLVHITYPAQKMPLTLQFAYANHGVNDINQAVTAVGNTARFQMRERDSGPAGAPPTPPSNAHTPQIVTAYLYIFGNIDVGMIASGSYSGTVDLYVQYY
ncbi:MAG: hypothetical protein HOM93_06095 [Candidatus Marinimicrobia bacterium]|nr:hypothetical protein [Candidatus Neomarinimicrobiota bacterium]